MYSKFFWWQKNTFGAVFCILLVRCRLAVVSQIIRYLRSLSHKLQLPYFQKEWYKYVPLVHSNFAVVSIFQKVQEFLTKYPSRGILERFDQNHNICIPVAFIIFLLFIFLATIFQFFQKSCKKFVFFVIVTSISFCYPKPLGSHTQNRI